MQVQKRDGRLEDLNIDKLHKVVMYACEDITGVSASQVEINSQIQFFDKIVTEDIQETLIKSAADLITEETPNYQYVAGRLINYHLRKMVYGKFEPPCLCDIVQDNIDKGFYDPEFVELFTKDEINELQNFIDHSRDEYLTYAAMEQFRGKYLVQNRATGEIFETPQVAYMMIAATLFSKYPKETRMGYIKRYYDAISRFKISLPTPVMAGVRTPQRQFSSCVLIETDDSLDSINATASSIVKYVSQKAGIGIGAGRVRAIGSKIRSGDATHTGVIPFYKLFQSAVKSCSQGGVRGGAATLYYPIWHLEIEDMLVLKNNKGTEDNRVRKLDYSIQLSKLFYERFIENKEVSLFSPHDCPGLFESFGTDKFDELYRYYEDDKSVPRATIGGQELILSLLKERAETGRIYLMNIDHVNTHSSFKDKVSMSNLCQEITLPTDPISHIDDAGGEIALCILSAINVGKIRRLTELEGLCDLAVRGLEELIDYQNYPVKAAERSTIARRSLGIGYIGLAHYLAKNGEHYADKGAWKLVHDLTEAFQYNLLKASNNLAKERGACDGFQHTKYSDGILPIDTYKKEVDEIVENTLAYDWDSLRDDIKEFGLRHSTLSAQMPSESSSIVSNATNGIEPPRDYLSVKKSKKGPLKQIVPQYNTYRNNYTLLWDMESNEGYIKIVAVMQKFFDQAISGNWSYNPENYPDNKVPVSVMAGDLLATYKYGWKTSYYQNTYDIKKDEETPDNTEVLDNLINDIMSGNEAECDACNV